MSGTILSGKQLKAARALAGATQREIARIAGIHVNSVRYIERKEEISEIGYTVEHVINALRSYGVVLSLDGSQGVSLEIAYS